MVPSIKTLSILLCDLKWPLPAFSAQTLTSTRWLLDGCAEGIDNPIWHNILKVDAMKQELFMNRIIFLHNRASKRSGKAASCHLAISEWCSEVERMCLAHFIHEQMGMAVNSDGAPLFEESAKSKVLKRTIDGKEHIVTLPPAAQFATVDGKLEELSKDARKMVFDQDCLKLTRDVAQLGCLYQAEVKSERSNRVQRVLHLKHQNRVGASAVKQFMDLNLHCVTGRPGELEAAADKFINELSGHDRWSGSIVWLDFTKYGKLSGSDLNDCCDLLAMILGRKPQKSVGLIMAPHLISEKVHNGLRGEMRMAAAPGQKHVPLQFPGWICMEESTMADNIWGASQLVADRCTRSNASWLAESNYVVPAAGKDMTPSSAETRSMSAYQESAQYLAGKDVVDQLLSSLFAKVAIPEEAVVGLFNLSPYDAWLELTAYQWPRTHQGMCIPVVSLGKSLGVNEYVERSLALKLMEEWKRGNHLMGERTPKYKPEFEPPEKVELQKFPLQIAKIDTIAGKTGWAKYKISLPQSFRSLHYSDVLFGPDWRELIADFDKKFETNLVSDVLSSSGAPESLPDTVSDKPAWEEPTTLEELTKMYHIENRIAGRVAGTTLYLVQVRSMSPPDSSTPVPPPKDVRDGGDLTSLKGKVEAEVATMAEASATSEGWKASPLPMSSSLSSQKNDPKLSPCEVDSLSAQLESTLQVRRGRPKKEDKEEPKDVTKEEKDEQPEKVEKKAKAAKDTEENIERTEHEQSAKNEAKEEDEKTMKNEMKQKADAKNEKTSKKEKSRKDEEKKETKEDEELGKKASKIGVNRLFTHRAPKFAAVKSKAKAKAKSKAKQVKRNKHEDDDAEENPLDSEEDLSEEYSAWEYEDDDEALKPKDLRKEFKAAALKEKGKKKAQEDDEEDEDAPKQRKGSKKMNGEGKSKSGKFSGTGNKSDKKKGSEKADNEDKDLKKKAAKKEKQEKEEDDEEYEDKDLKKKAAKKKKEQNEEEDEEYEDKDLKKKAAKKKKEQKEEEDEEYEDTDLKKKAPKKKQEEKEEEDEEYQEEPKPKRKAKEDQEEVQRKVKDQKKEDNEDEKANGKKVKSCKFNGTDKKSEKKKTEEAKTGKKRAKKEESEDEDQKKAAKKGISKKKAEADEEQEVVDKNMFTGKEKKEKDDDAEEEENEEQDPSIAKSTEKDDDSDKEEEEEATPKVKGSEKKGEGEDENAADKKSLSGTGKKYAKKTSNEDDDVKKKKKAAKEEEEEHEMAHEEEEDDDVEDEDVPKRVNGSNAKDSQSSKFNGTGKKSDKKRSKKDDNEHKDLKKKAAAKEMEEKEEEYEDKDLKKKAAKKKKEQKEEDEEEEYEDTDLKKKAAKKKKEQQKEEEEEEYEDKDLKKKAAKKEKEEEEEDEEHEAEPKRNQKAKEDQEEVQRKVKGKKKEDNEDEKANGKKVKSGKFNGTDKKSEKKKKTEETKTGKKRAKKEDSEDEDQKKKAAKKLKTHKDDEQESDEREEDERSSNEGEASNDESEPEEKKKVKGKKRKSQGDVMRDAYHDFVKTHMALVKDENPTMSGELEYMKVCAFHSDLDRVILEMPNESGKGTTDSDISSIRALLHEMEQEEVVDCTINLHELSRPPACGDGAAAADS
ncbi:unnamed protein product [Durusdinium trenchii]|uniref:Uncharacterized protein n=1 Tax=Durusdinium trenchii TaxID=1381693 RepID=A0ABP0RML2_9DINO